MESGIGIITCCWIISVVCDSGKATHFVVLFLVQLFLKCCSLKNTLIILTVPNEWNKQVKRGSVRSHTVYDHKQMLWPKLVVLSGSIMKSMLLRVWVLSSCEWTTQTATVWTFNFMQKLELNTTKITK